jgi:beta-lactam-binding protein with PASTA domain
MARVFNITAPTSTIALDGQGRGEIAFTVANASGRPLRGRAVLVPQDSSQKGWLTIAGEAERDFPAGGVQQFSVQVAAPAGSKPGNYTLRLDAFSVQNPDEDYAQGATVAFTVPMPKNGHHFPWWIVAVAGVLIIAGVTTWLLLRGRVTVPDVTGKTLIDANTALAQVNLKVGNVTNVLSTATNVDKVLSQSPAAGQSARGGSGVDVQVGVAIVVVPTLVGKTYADAVSALHAAALDAGNVTNVNQPGAKPSQVLASNPVAGNSVKSHTPIDLTIQQENVPVPNLVGQPFQAAVAMLTSANLILGSVSGNIYQLVGFAQVPNAPVTSQSPAAGTSATVGSQVNLVFPGTSLNQFVVKSQAARVQHW